MSGDPLNVPVRGPLTPREWEVVRRSALGETREQIAYALGISVSTVRRHRNNAGAKYGAPTITDLYRALDWLRVPPK